MDYSILIRLVLAHLLSDFVFQSRKWAEEKDAKGFQSGYLYLHILVTGLTAMLLVGDINWLLPIGLITVIHGLLDGLKSGVNKRFFHHHWYLLKFYVVHFNWNSYQLLLQLTIWVLIPNLLFQGRLIHPVSNDGLGKIVSISSKWLRVK